MDLHARLGLLVARWLAEAAAARRVHDHGRALTCEDHAHALRALLEN